MYLLFYLSSMSVLSKLERGESYPVPKCGLNSNFKVFKCAETDAGAFALLLRVKVKW